MTDYTKELRDLAIKQADTHRIEYKQSFLTLGITPKDGVVNSNYSGFIIGYESGFKQSAAEIDRLRGEVERLTIDNMAHEFNQAEAEKFAPEYKRQIREDEANKWKEQVRKLREGLEEMISTIERNAVDNRATIVNVKLWAKSWREELLTETEG